MRKLTELLDRNLSFDEILDNLSEQTEDFTSLEGEIAFDDQYEAEVAVSILKNHYENVDNSGLDVINKDDSGFVIKFSSPIVDDFSFPVEEEEVKESLNETVSYGSNLRNKYKINPDIKIPEQSKWAQADLEKYWSEDAHYAGGGCPGFNWDAICHPNTQRAGAQTFYNFYNTLGHLTHAQYSQIDKFIFHNFDKLASIVDKPNSGPELQQFMKAELSMISTNELAFSEAFMYVFTLVKGLINSISQEESLTEEIVDLRQKYKRNPNIKIPEEPKEPELNATNADYNKYFTDTCWTHCWGGHPGFYWAQIKNPDKNYYGNADDFYDWYGEVVRNNNYNYVYNAYTSEEMSSLDFYILKHFTELARFVAARPKFNDATLNACISKFSGILKDIVVNGSNLLDRLSSEKLRDVCVYIYQIVLFLYRNYNAFSNKKVNEAVSYGSDLRNKYKINKNIQIPEPEEQKTTGNAKFDIVLDLERQNGLEISWGNYTIGDNDVELIELKNDLDKLEKVIDNYRHIKLSITDLQYGEVVEQTFDDPIDVNDIRQMISEFTGLDVGTKSAKKISSSIWQNSRKFWSYYDSNSKLALVTADDALAINPYIETEYKWMYSSVFDFVKQAYPVVAAHLKIIPAENTIHDNVMPDIIDAIKRDIIETIRQRNGVAGLHIIEPDNTAEYIYNVVAWLGITKGKLFESLNEEIVDLRQKYKRNPNIKLPDKKPESTKKATIDDFYDPEDGFWGLKTYASEVSDLYSKLYEHYLGNQSLNLRDNEIKTIDKFIYQWFDKFMIAWHRLESIGKSEEEKLRTCIKTVSQKNDAYILLGVNDKEAAGKYLYVMMHLFDKLLNQKDESLNEEIVDLRQKYKRNPNIKLSAKETSVEDTVKLAEKVTTFKDFMLEHGWMPGQQFVWAEIPATVPDSVDDNFFDYFYRRWNSYATALGRDLWLEREVDKVIADDFDTLYTLMRQDNHTTQPTNPAIVEIGSFLNIFCAPYKNGDRHIKNVIDYYVWDFMRFMKDNYPEITS